MESLKGKLLLASAQLLDPNFVQTVVLMVQHNEQGAMGLVLNRPLEIDIRKAWGQVSQSECVRQEPLHVGGPCEGVLMAVHGYAKAAQVEILPGLYFATETEHLEWLLQQRQGAMRFFVGYAGWTAGQLEQELEIGSWLVTPATVERTFLPDEQQWDSIKRELAMAAVQPGYRPEILPQDPSRN